MKFSPNLFDRGIFTEKEKNMTIPELNLLNSSIRHMVPY